MHAASRQCPKHNSLFLNSSKKSYWLPQKPVPPLHWLTQTFSLGLRKICLPQPKLSHLRHRKCLNSSPVTYLLNKYLQTATIHACSYCFHYFAHKGPYSQSYGFSSCYVWLWELNHKESWELKNWCFWTVVLEKTLGLQGDPTSPS